METLRLQPRRDDGKVGRDHRPYACCKMVKSLKAMKTLEFEVLDQLAKEMEGLVRSRLVCVGLKFQRERKYRQVEVGTIVV